MRLVVSKGPERFRVDTALVAKPWAEVEPKLQESLPEIAFTTTEQHDDDIPAGAVVAFDPPAGTDLKRDQVVTVIVSLGPRAGRRPRRHRADARAGRQQPHGRGLQGRSGRGRAQRRRRRRRGHGDRRPARPTGPQPFGSTVTISVSAGLPQVTVPELKGMTEEEATAALQAVGLAVDSTKFLGNKVRQQQPAAGEVVEQGTTVKILVAP